MLDLLRVIPAQARDETRGSILLVRRRRAPRPERGSHEKMGRENEGSGGYGIILHPTDF